MERFEEHAMKIEQIMTPSPATCGPTDNLGQVVEHMWDADCGIVPVVDDGGHLLGVITDRDICIATGTRDLAPAQIRAVDMVRGSVVACRPDDDLQTALALMKQHRLRRLPVTTEEGVLHGIVSLNDIALIAGRKETVTASDVLAVMKAIGAHPLPAASHAAA
jgi:CBS domain-containing protein